MFTYVAASCTLQSSACHAHKYRFSP
jgi:hypothetical protein